MDLYCKQLTVVSEVTELLEEKVKEQHTDDPEELCPVQRETEANGEDCRGAHSSGFDKNSYFSEPLNENIDEELDIKYHSSVCGDTSGDLSQHHSSKLDKQLSGCDDKDNADANKGKHVVRDFSKKIIPLQSDLYNQVKEEISVNDLESPTVKNLLCCFFCGAKFATGGLLTKHVNIHTGEKEFCCIICKRTFSVESELLSHVCACQSPQHHQSKTEEQNTVNKLLNCSQCGEEFSKRQDLNVHLRCHTREDSFKCSVCTAVCTDRDALIQHMRIHTRQTQFSCSVCGKDFAWRRHLTKHMEVHKKRKKVFRCKICSAEFCSYYVLSKHKLIHQSSELDNDQTEENGDNQENMEAAADGEDCREPEASKTITHLQPETDEETSPAFKAGDGDFWEETRESQSDLSSVKHDDVSENDTKMDMQQFTFRDDLSQHTVYQTEEQSEVKQEDPEPPEIKVEPEETEIAKFTCSPVAVKTEDEEKPQFSELYLNQTEESKDSVGGPEPVKNSDPDFGTMSLKSDDSDFWKETKEPQSGNSETDSWKNQLSGSDEKPSESLQPESDDSVDSDFWKDFKKPQSSLNSLKHEASERGAKYVNDLKPYSCSMCSKAFRYSSYLKTHMKQHTERYFCSLCGYKSTSSSNLKVHMRTHTGEKPFSCPICDKKYTNKASMQSHMSVHAAERKYSCDVCKKSFAWYTELKYHQCLGESSQKQTYEEEANINLKCNKLYS